MTRKQIERMTPETFKKLDYCAQVEFLETCKADYAVIADLIRDRNEFRDCYKSLYIQLKDNGIEPDTDYFTHIKKGKTKNV